MTVGSAAAPVAPADRGGFAGGLRNGWHAFTATLGWVLAALGAVLPFLLLAGLGVIILFLANAYLLGREYFELAALRYRPLEEVRAMRRRHAFYLFLAGLPIAAFVSVPIVNLLTPLFGAAYMVRIHKRLSRNMPLVERSRPR